MMRARAATSCLRAALAVPLLAALAAAATGCAHDSAADRQFARLSDDVNRLTSERDAVTSRAAPVEAPAPTPAAVDTSPARPPADIDTTPPFDEPGYRDTGDGTGELEALEFERLCVDTMSG
ncbi:MAG TPA: hypothetical protein PLR99_13775, partial [Polyangiaceae bacterium]|nr:hypothetical protein [Polyangiaceae bacterium]